MIPKHIILNIKKVYEASCETLGSPFKTRRLNFLNILKAYYPWEQKKTLTEYYKVIKPYEDEYYIKKRIDSIKNKHDTTIKRLFGTLDKDCNECIDMKEFQSLASHTGIDMQRINELFHSADKNKDGVLSYKEFYYMICENEDFLKQIEHFIETLLEHESEIKLEKQNAIFKYNIEGRQPGLIDVKSINNVSKSIFYEYNTLK